MGSWLGTCGITQVPIYSGDDVVLIFLVSTTDNERCGGHLIYSNSFWTPISIQFYGKYDGYGGIIEKNWHTDFFIETLSKNIIHKDNKSYELSFNTLFELIKNDNAFLTGLRLSTFEKGKHPIGYMVVLRSVFEIMCQKTTGFWQRDINQISSLIKTIDGKRLVDNFIENPLIIQDFSHYFDLLREDSDTTEILLEMSKFCIFCINLQECRKVWLPQIGAGSQNENFELHKKLLHNALRHISERKIE